MRNEPASLDEVRIALEQGETTSRKLVEKCNEQIENPVGEGNLTYISVDIENARHNADEIDKHRHSGATLPAYAGIPVSIKDLFDIEGQTTLAGSKVLAGHPAAQKDSFAVAKLRDAGFILIGRTNMTEFAYSGLGINPHYGTPSNHYERHHKRIPGGSSSGAAISVTDQMAHAALGTDTDGSCRIPAAMTGLVGFKPSASRNSREGAATIKQL